jgi:hypothetical protein
VDKSKSKVTEEEAISFIDGIGHLFSHVLDKDYFLELYQANVFYLGVLVC